MVGIDNCLKKWEKCRHELLGKSCSAGVVPLAALSVYAVVGCATVEVANDGLLDDADAGAEVYAEVYDEEGPGSSEESVSDDFPQDTETGAAPEVDKCPGDEEKIAPGMCGCGSPETDSDGDGVPDCADECPEDPDKSAPGECGCGAGEDICVTTCASGHGRRDPDTKLCWQHASMGLELTWKEAVDYCANLSLDGVQDWRLPTREELLDLLDECEEEVLQESAGYCSPCIDSETCAALFESDEEVYWSSTLDESEKAWLVKFNTGRVRKNYTSRMYNARCVKI